MTHIYLMPGMAANPSIFEHFQFSEDRFTIHKLEWQLPEQDESLVGYARRMAENIYHKDIVLLGVSFGGVLVQEMAQFLSIKKLIIVSSVKSKAELPRRMKLSRKLKLYKILPTRLVEDIDLLAKYAFGETVKNRVALYQKYLSMNDRRYLSWAIKEMVCWDREIPDSQVIHVHGDTDRVFPMRYIKDCISISGGSHIMVITKYKWFNKHLPQIIEND